MAKLVRFRVLDSIAVITLDAPPVNALSTALRAGLWEAFERVEANTDIKAVVLTAAGRIFSAGGNIREFEQDPRPPTLSQLCARIEACTKPVVAAAQGQALGGGAEMLLAAHYRLASSEARIGFPEVTLGLVPGAGGTQRLPRLIGADRALQLIVTGHIIDAAAAHGLGLIDGVMQGDLSSGALKFAKQLLERGHGPRRSRDQRKHLKNGLAFQATVTKARAALANNPQHAPQRAVDCIEAASLLPFDAALTFEADAFARCLAHPQSVAFRHVFIAERKIDSALIERDGAAFKPVAPMGKAAASRLRGAMRAAAEFLVEQGHAEAADIDGAMVAYGFRKGPFGGKEAGPQDADITHKLIAAMLVEGAACVDEQAVQRPSDIDALSVHCIGFPRREGGPMRAAQSIGLIGLRNDMRVWAQASDIWAVPALMDDAIKDVRGFDSISVLVPS